MTKKQKFPYLVGSKWTATKKIDGWRHFQVVNRKNQGKWVYAEMVAACDPQVRFWLNAKLLQDGFQWQAGWQSLQEIEAVDRGLGTGDWGLGNGGDEGDEGDEGVTHP